jgi:hypothetical protein
LSRSTGRYRVDWKSIIYAACRHVFGLIILKLSPIKKICAETLSTNVPRGGNQGDLHASRLQVIREYLQWHHAYEVKIAGGPFQRASLPDIFAAMPIPGTTLAAFVVVEVKTGTGELTEGQAEECAKIAAAGGIVIVTDTVDDVEARLIAEGLVQRSLQ